MSRSGSSVAASLLFLSCTTKMHIEPEVLSQLPDEKKVELFDWLISKIAVINPDYWEHDATMVFPTFYFQFDTDEVLADSSVIMLAGGAETSLLCWCLACVQKLISQPFAINFSRKRQKQ